MIRRDIIKFKPKAASLQHGNERLRYAVAKLIGQFFAVGPHDRFVAKVDDRSIFTLFEDTPKMLEKADVFPPANGLIRRHVARRRLIADRGVRDRNVLDGGKLEERRIEGQHLFAFGACAFGKDDDAFAVVEAFDDLFAGTRNVAAIL